ncbi:MAG TPA: hypothetical protein VES64_05355 [Allosphingosinicella sp.]|nr:hypothetical protein [Allosphingosinicella sp.]
MPSLNGNVAALALLALCAAEPALARISEPPAMPTAEPTPRLGTDTAPVAPAGLPVREEEGCCNGMGGPVEEEPVVVLGPLADPAAEWRRWVAPTDANFERRYAPRPAPSLNPITLRF